MTLSWVKDGHLTWMMEMGWTAYALQRVKAKLSEGACIRSVDGEEARTNMWMHFAFDIPENRVGNPSLVLGGRGQSSLSKRTGSITLLISAFPG